jgi:thioredoxin 1
MSNLNNFAEATFEEDVLQSEGPVLVEFHADWCGPCKMMGPVVDRIAVEYEGRLSVGKLDVDENPGVAMRYGVMGIPTLGIFQDGKMVDRLVGYPGPNGVRTFVEKNTTTKV